MAHPHLDWRPVRTSAQAVINARVALALLRIHRKLPLAEDECDSVGVARCLWPAIRLFPDLLIKGLRSFPSRIQVSQLDAISMDDQAGSEMQALTRARRLPYQPLTDSVFGLLGKAIVSHTPAFAPLLKAVETTLDALAAHSIAADHRERMIADLLSLSQTERAFLRLCTAVAVSPLQASHFSTFKPPMTLVRAIQAAVCAKDEHEVRAMLNRNSTLFRSGMLDCDPWGLRTDMADVLRLSEDATKLLRAPAKTVQGLAKVILREAAPSNGEPLEWPHLAEHTALLRNLLANAIRGQQQGINVLLYGTPGTGKTQYALRLIEEAGLRGYVVSDLDRLGGAASRSERLSSLMLTQLFAPAERSVILLDEAEDIFKDEYNNPLARAFGRKEDAAKSWMNRLLEENARPVLWISNRVDHIDPAYLRRFAYCLEFPTTPRQVRRQVADAHLGRVGCSASFVDRVAAQADVSPALMASAVRGASIAGGGDVDETVGLVLGGLLRAAGGKFQAQIPAPSTRFDLDYINVAGQIPADLFVSSICRLGRARTVLSGPPGTGKTQLAGEIAARMGRELLYRTASDINSMWYGQSERNVARMFEDCDPSAEILFLDEADALLGSRESAGHRADVAVTAEFLRQIEAFKGVLICATNFRSHLDPALLRRFEFRLELLPLSESQRKRMFVELAIGQCDDLTVGAVLAPSHERRLSRLDQLTPGDFANVVRRLQALQVSPGVDGWLSELEIEHQAKPGGRRGTVGFL